MQTITRNTLKLILALVVLVALFGAGFHSSVAYAACLPTVIMSYGPRREQPHYMVLLGYHLGLFHIRRRSTNLPGPQLTVNQGDCVSVTLHNSLTETTALLFRVRI